MSRHSGIMAASVQTALRDERRFGVTKPLLFVAASGLARETLIVVRAYGLYDVVGILDDDPALAGTTIDGVPVLGPIDGMAAYRSAQLLVCAGHGASRERIVARLDVLGVPPTRY